MPDPCQASEPYVLGFNTNTPSLGGQRHFTNFCYNGGVMRKKVKPVYLRIRLPKIEKTGGAHQPAKGGKYRRGKEKEKSRKDIRAELD